MLVDMFNYDKVKNAIDILKMYEPKEGYYLAFSGGKDSICIYQLALMSGVKFDAHYNLTTVDPPELVRFIKKEYPDVEIHRPEKTMWELIIHKKSPPTRISRYCCKDLKEYGGKHRIVLTGIRWEESSQRSNHKLVHICKKNSKTTVSPIINWLEIDVWEFIKGYSFSYPDLYNQGYRRLGCIGCPMNSQRKEELEKFPKYKQAYIRAFTRMIQNRIDTGLETKWKTGQEVMDWWLSN